MSEKSLQTLPPIGSITIGTRTTDLAPAAASRWNVEKKRLELDKEIAEHYDAQVSKFLTIDKVANDRISKAYNEIYYKVKWSNPPLPAVQQKLFTEYCQHLLTIGPKVQFSGVSDLRVWKKKLSTTIHGKLVDEITKMCLNLRGLVEKRDNDLAGAQANLIATTELKNVRKDGTLRWMMEKNTSKRDEYFTVWYLASNGRIRELEVLLNAPSKGVTIDDRDPDFGLTPLHYASKTNQYPMMKYLIAKGADLTLRTPDGRTPLHLAAAYGSREMVLELLGACVDYDALDNYGCTALQLAVQSKNVRTIDTLRNWTRLTLLPAELQALDRRQLQGPSSSAGYTEYSKHNTLASGLSGVSSPMRIQNTALSGTGQSLPASPTEWNSQQTATFQPSTSEILDTSIPEEYQPVSAEVLKKMSPALSLLTKRLNAYNLYLPRNATNYVPTEMLRSRDLSNMSTMLYEQAGRRETVGGEWSSDAGSVVGIAIGRGTATGEEIGLRTPLRFDKTQSKAVISELDASVERGSSSRIEQTVIAHDCAQIIEGSAIEPDVADSCVEDLEPFDDTYFETQFNECMVEIRLTSKHYALCVQEGLLPEAMRSLRRRWLVAKRLWGLVTLQRALRLRREERERQAHEERMTALWTGGSGGFDPLPWDEDGGPGDFQEEGGDGVALLQFPSELMASDAAVDENLPHKKYLPMETGLSAEPGGGVVGKEDADGDKMDTISNREELNGAGSAAEVNAEASDDDEDDTTLSQPAVTLETLKLAYEAMLLRQRYEELNPRPENLSASALLRPSDYDSVDAPMYKVKDNVYWETRSGLERANASPRSKDGSSGVGPGSQASAEPQEAHDTSVDAGDMIAAPFSPSALQETNAWEAIQKWQYVAEERRSRRPNIDIYSTMNDECIGTSSLLTFSVTEAPSTEGPSTRPDSPGGSSLATHSFFLAPAAGQTIAPGVFKENARGGYVIKLGMDLYGVLLVRREEGPALRVLCECVEIDQEVETTLKISLFERQVDLLLHMHDCFERTKDSIRDVLTGNAGSNLPKLKLKVPIVRVEPSVRTIMTERVLGMLSVLEGLTDEAQGIPSDGPAEVDAGVEVPATLDEGDLRGVGTDALPPSGELSGDPTPLLEGSELDSQLQIVPEQRATNTIPGASDAEPDAVTVVEDGTTVRFADPLVTTDGSSDLLRQESESAIARIGAAQQGILTRCVALTDQSIAVHREAYREDLVEPASLAVALMQRARVAERLFDGETAMDFAEQAEVAAVRALGGGSQLAIGIMLEGLRLFVKYRLVDRADLEIVNRRAAEIRKYIVQFSFTDVRAADKFTQKCVEYLSISSVAIREKEMKIRRAEEEAKLAAAREARRKILEAQKGVGRKHKF